MKNLNLQNSISSRIAILCFIATMLLVSCDKVEKPQIDHQEPSKEMLAHLIKLEKAAIMYKKYEEQRIAITEDTLKVMYGKEFNDTRTVWLNLEIIKNYIAYVEKKSADNHVKPEGLQFYFSVYPKGDKGNEENHQTLFIAPTTKNNEVQSGYTLIADGDKEKVTFIKDALKSRDYQSPQEQKADKASFFTTTALLAGEGLILNGGTGSPPN